MLDTVVGEDGGVSVLFECADELRDEVGGDLRTNDSRHVRAPLVGVFVVVDRNAPFLRTLIGWAEDEGNKVDERTNVVDVIGTCTSVERTRLLLDSSSGADSLTEPSFLFLETPSTVVLPDSKLEFLFPSSLLFPSEMGLTCAFDIFPKALIL